MAGRLHLLLFLVIILISPVCVYALSAAARVVEAPQDSAEAHLGKGYELVAKERYREAVREFQAALLLNPRLVRARYQLAVCYFAVGNHSESRKEFDKLVSETSGAPEVLYHLGRLDLADGKLDSAIAHLSKVASAPPFPDTPYYLGCAYLNKGELELAERWFLKAADADPYDSC